MRSLPVFVLLITVLHICSIDALKVSCKNEDNSEVDWYYLYKLPKHHSNSIDFVDSGLRYTYVTADTFGTQGWQLSSKLINDSTSFPGHTVADLFDDKEVLLVAYNDEIPDGPTDFKNGHTKGVVATDGVSAIWLVHSVPKYPKISNYTYPTTGEHFGQSFLCVTLNTSTEMDNVATQLLFNEPNVYFSRIPEELKRKYPAIEEVIAGKWRTEGPFQNLVELKSLGGTEFQSFAKGRHFNKELYKDWVAPTFDVDLLVESWRNSAGKLPSDCSRRDKVYNVAMIHNDKLNFSFKSTTDHSKWAVSNANEEDWICVGDINRDEHQLVRGGGTVCQKNHKMAELYRRLIDQYDKC